MSFDAYKVAINLKLEDQFSDAMGLFTDKLGESSKHAEELQKKLEKLKEALKATNASATGADILGGAAEKAAGKWQKLTEKIKETYKTAAAISLSGWGMAAMLKQPLAHAAKQEQQLIKLRTMNFDSLDKGTKAAVTRQAARIARSTAGTTDADALRIATESQVITGDVKKTKALAPMVAKLRFGIEAYAAGNGDGEGKGDEAEKKFFELMQKLKDSGVTKKFSVDKYRSLADIYLKSYLARNGDVDDDKFIAMAKSGKITDQSIMRAQGVNRFYAREARSGQGALVDLKAKWAELEEQFGRAALPVVKGIMEHVIPALKSIGAWMEKHKDAVAYIAKGFILLSVGLMIAGPLFALGKGLQFLSFAATFASKPLRNMAIGMILNGMRGGEAVAKLAASLETGRGQLKLLGKGIMFLGRALLLNPIGLVVTGIATAAYFLWKNWDVVGPKVKAVWGNIKTGWAAFLDWFHQKWEAFKSHLPSFLVGDTHAPEPEQHPTVRPHSVAKINQNGDVYLDGKKVGKVIAPHVSREQARAAARPTGGTTGYDSSMSPVPVGAV